MVVYIDVLFVENFIVDYLLLFGSARLGGVRLRRWRMLLAAFLGAAYSVAVYPLPWLGALPVKLCVGAAMALICYGGMARPARNVLLFFFTAFTFGGCTLAVAQITGDGGGTMPVRTLAIAMLLTFGILVPIFSRLARHGGVRRDTAGCVVTQGGKTLELTALIDTGNTLTDPLTGAAVIVAEPDSLKPIFGSEAVLRLKRHGALAAFEQLGDTRFRLIPCRTVGSECTFLLAMKPDSVTLGGRRLNGALLAASQTGISDGGGYNALAGSAM